MPPKRQHSVSSIDINTVSTSKFRSNAASDLVTKSEAALSSQASVLQKTQGSQASLDPNFNYALPDHEDMQFNREEMSEVHITKEEQEVIQKILELARKGKVNSKNAFEIPIKVVSSESSFSINNKFWKFASELLSASMSIYDKRVENMYLSAGAFENKLSRIGFDIKNRKPGERDEQRHDDVNADEEARAKRNREERQEMLKISVDDFSGSLDLEDKSINGISTLEKKEKLSIKNMEQQFIADHTFQRTQKMFDSFSLKSLMLNIFELSTDLDVRIFIKSDLEWQKLKQNQKDRTQANIESQKPQKQQLEESKQEDEVKTETVTNKFSSIEEQNQVLKLKYDKALLSHDFLKHIEVSKSILEEHSFLDQIQNFIVKQPQLKQDYLARNNHQKRNLNRLELEDNEEDNFQDMSYGEIIERERNEYSQLLKEFQESYDEDIGGHHFQEIQEGSGLFEAQHLSQSQNFDTFHNTLNFSQQMFNRSEVEQISEANSMPLSFHDNFYGWDEKNNIIEPIMPWEIQFKNLQLTKKRKKGSKNQKKENKKNSKKSQFATADFDLSITDRKETLKLKDVKSKFQNQKFLMKFKQCNTVSKEFDIVHSQYHTRFNNHFIHQRNSFIKSQKKNQEYQKKPSNVIENTENFILDFDQATDPAFGNKLKSNENQNYDDQTRLMESENFPQNFESQNLFEGEKPNNNNSSFTGIQMGVNNIREIKKIIVDEVNQKGKTTLERMNKLLVNLSPQQMFTIFLHLTNEHHFQISNGDPEQTTVVLHLAERRRNNRREQRNGFQDVEI